MNWLTYGQSEGGEFDRSYLLLNFRSLRVALFVAPFLQKTP